MSKNFKFKAQRRIFQPISEDAQMEPMTGFNFGGSTNPMGYPYDPPDVINVLTQDRADLHYLEIGVDQGNTFDHITNVEVKHGVDPYGASGNITHRMTSQLFFSLNHYFFHHRYDIIFIDGLHLFDVVHEEVQKSLQLLRENGLIVLHDTCPILKSRQQIWLSDYEAILDNVITAEKKDRLAWHENTAASEPKGLNGDVWKNAAYLRTFPDLTVFSIPQACITIVSPRKLDKFDTPTPEIDLSTLNWDAYYTRFEEIMNPVSLEYFKENIGEYLPRNG
jgi:hypothetical protein